VSQAGASLVLVVILFGLAVYWAFSPPVGFQDGVLYRFTMPFVLIVVCFSVLENLRTRTHIAQLVGALRALMGKSGRTATPEVTREAIDILLAAVRDGQPRARKTAAEQLRNLTGQDHGEDAEAWQRWWNANRETFQRQS